MQLWNLYTTHRHTPHIYHTTHRHMHNHTPATAMCTHHTLTTPHPPISILYLCGCLMGVDQVPTRAMGELHSIHQTLLDMQETEDDTRLSPSGSNLYLHSVTYTTIKHDNRRSIFACTYIRS